MVQPGVNERTDQPRPNRPLVVRRVAGSQVAVIFRFIIGMIGRQAAQADRRQQVFRNLVEHGLPARWIEHRVVKGDGKDLLIKMATDPDQASKMIKLKK